MNIPYVFKKCTKCGEWLPATKEYFHKKKDGKYGLRADCKKCHAEYKRQYQQENKEAIAERKKKHYQANKEAILEQKRQYYQANKEAKAEYNRQYYEANKEEIAEQHRQYRETHKEAEAERNKQWREANKEYLAEHSKQYREQNKERIAERQRQYYEANKETLLKYSRQYYEANKEVINECNRQYYEQNKERIAERKRRNYEQYKERIAKYYQSPRGQVVAFNNQCRRRAKEQAQGRGITKEQWLECMKFFGFRCAYSGEPLTKDNRSLDHIDPLNKGGANEIWNLVPMYKNYNFSKCDKDMLEWYTERPYFSQERLNKIYEWQEYAFNKWGIDTEAQ